MRQIPAMIEDVNECKTCYNQNICSLVAISVEADMPRQFPIGNFDGFKEIQ